MRCRKTNQILWYFYQVITDKCSIIGLNNSLRSITKKSVLRYVGLIFLPVSLKVVIFMGKIQGSSSIKESRLYDSTSAICNDELQKMLYI